MGINPFVITSYQLIPSGHNPSTGVMYAGFDKEGYHPLVTKLKLIIESHYIRLLQNPNNFPVINQELSELTKRTVKDTVCTIFIKRLNLEDHYGRVNIRFTIKGYDLKFLFNFLSRQKTLREMSLEAVSRQLQSPNKLGPLEIPREVIVDLQNACGWYSKAAQRRSHSVKRIIHHHDQDWQVRMGHWGYVLTIFFLCCAGCYTMLMAFRTL